MDVAIPFIFFFFFSFLLFFLYILLSCSAHCARALFDMRKWAAVDELYQFHSTVHHINQSIFTKIIIYFYSTSEFALELLCCFMPFKESVMDSLELSGASPPVPKPVDTDSPVVAITVVPRLLLL